jgi:hypothetical protein
MTRTEEGAGLVGLASPPQAMSLEGKVVEKVVETMTLATRQKASAGLVVKSG